MNPVTAQTIGSVMMGGLALGVSPSPPAPKPAPVVIEFNEIFRAAELSRRIREIEISKPRVVKVEHILPDASEEQLVPVLPPRTPKPKPVDDICTRHHLHKVWSGKSWRCKKL